MKSELNWTLFTLIIEVLRRSFWLFCKINKAKTTLGFPYLLIEFMVSVEKLGCAFKVFWIMIKYWNVWKFNQVIFYWAIRETKLTWSTLKIIFWTTFWWLYVINYVYMFVIRNETLFLNCSWSKQKIHEVTGQF